jgi:glycosyltransferase involved in cell wall biosynthesis
MRIDFVVPRYGVRGGAENAVRMTAERVSSLLGWDVHLHATTARSSGSWANEDPQGIEIINGVTVHRHHVDSGRTAEWGPLNERVKASPTTIDPVSEAAFFATQGPVSSALARAVARSDAELIVFAPYLFWTTVGVLGAVAERALVVPAAHDEPFLRLPSVQAVLTAAKGLVYGCAAERALLESVMPVAHLPHTVLGWGIDAPADAGESSPGDRQSLVADGYLPDDGRPYVLCVGRIEHAKGTVGLAAFWRAYQERLGSDHRLVLMGECNAEIATDDNLVVVENADDATKWRLLRGADVMITPSAMESFSLVVFEAWAAGTPVLVNRHCGATHDHARHSGGGLWYGNYPEFEVSLSRLLADSDLRQTLARRGEEYGRTHYSWDAIVERFRRLCERVVETQVAANNAG